MSATLWEEWLNGSHRNVLHFDWWLEGVFFCSCPSIHCFLMRCHSYLSLPPEMMCYWQLPWKEMQPGKFLVGSRRVYVKSLLLDTRSQEQKQQQQQQSNFYCVHSWTSRNLAALETGKENQTFGSGIWKTLKPSKQLCEPYKTYNGFTGLILAAWVKAWQKSRDKRRSN